MQVMSHCIKNFIDSCPQPTQDNLRKTFSRLSSNIDQYFAENVDGCRDRIPEYAKDVFLLLVVYRPLQDELNKKRKNFTLNFSFANTGKVDSESKRLEELLTEYLTIFYSVAEDVFRNNQNLRLESKQDLCAQIKESCCTLQRALALCHEIFSIEFSVSIFENPSRYDSEQEVFSEKFSAALKKELTSHYESILSKNTILTEAKISS